MCQLKDQMEVVSVVTVAGICNSVGGGVFLDMPPQCRSRMKWRISVGFKARVVNPKQVDVTASRSRSFRLSWNVLIAHCTEPWGVH